MFRKITSFLLSLCISAAALSGMAVTASAAGTETRSKAWGEYSHEDGYYHISTAEQILALSDAINSGNNDPLRGSKYKLDNDIFIPEAYKGKINIASESKDSPFTGEFDGNGHTIYNFNAADGIGAGGNKGFFAFVKGATIKNVVFENADVDSVYCGGILVSQAEDSNIFNITIKNSNLQVISGGSVITLITAGGATGGAIAGVVKNCTLYNCEANYTNVYVNNGEGISALGGEGYYIGGLVGDMIGSTLEYSRAVGDGKNEGRGSAYVTSNMVLPVLAGKTAYVGGLAGMMAEDSKIIDSFCSTYVNSQIIVDVPLLGGANVRAGGIVGRIDGGNANLIERCHYSGLIESLATASHNINLGGIASYVDQEVGGNITRVTIKDCFYNWDKAVGEKTDPLIPVIQPVYGYSFGSPRYDAWDRITISNSASKENSVYSDIEHQWVPNGYDFNGIIQRTSAADEFLGGTHINQWVLDEENNMPVHGKTKAEIYSNITNAFIEEPEMMEYQYSINEDNMVVLPNETDVDSIDPGLENEGLVGIAFVSENEYNSNNVYTCDMLYAPGAEVDADVFEAYASDPDKRIYAVWCQAKTLGAQLGLNSGNEGLRVLTAVNTDLLDNIGLDLPDDEYGRGATFKTDNTEYFIKADSRVWRGEAYYDESKIDDVSNARVFSIFAFTDEDDYNKQIIYSGDILYNGIGEDGEAGLFDFLCNSFSGTVSDIAQRYLSDLEASGASEEDNYGLTDEQYGVLKQYID